MRAFAEGNGWELGIGQARRYHEICLSGPRRVSPEKRKTVLRLPLRRAGEGAPAQDSLPALANPANAAGRC